MIGYDSIVQIGHGKSENKVILGLPQDVLDWLFKAPSEEEYRKRLERLLDMIGDVSGILFGQRFYNNDTRRFSDV